MATVSMEDGEDKGLVCLLSTKITHLAKQIGLSCGGRQSMFVKLLKRQAVSRGGRMS